MAAMCHRLLRGGPANIIVDILSNLLIRYDTSGAKSGNFLSSWPVACHVILEIIFVPICLMVVLTYSVCMCSLAAIWVHVLLPMT